MKKNIIRLLLPLSLFFSFSTQAHYDNRLSLSARIKEAVLIGDAMTDYYAAKKNKIKFYGYNNEELKKFGNYIEKFESIKL